MKTIEMLSELEKFPQNKYGITDGIYEYFMSIKNGFLYFETYKSGLFCNASFNGNIKLSDEWQLVKEPVTWQEAIQAWIDGKTICIKSESFDHQSIFVRTIEGKTKNIEALWKDSLINDKWYIKD